MKIESHSEYPSWSPERESPILDLIKRKYFDIYKAPVKVKAIHAGLECGILKDKI